MDHFDRVATVNGWADDKTLQWLTVCLTGRVATVYKSLPADTKADITQLKAAMKDKFEPESKKELYQAELDTRRRKRDEDWASLGEELLTLAERAYPDLQVEAQQQLALNRLLALVENPQIAFSVRQKAPKMIDAAVAATLEMESYLPQGKSKIASVGGDMSLPTKEAVRLEGTVAATTYRTDVMERLVERLDQIETELKEVRSSQRSTLRPKESSGEREGDPIICRRCGQPGHIAKGCRVRLSQKRQGNGKPLVQ